MQILTAQKEQTARKFAYEITTTLFTSWGGLGVWYKQNLPPGHLLHQQKERQQGSGRDEALAIEVQ